MDVRAYLEPFLVAFLASILFLWGGRMIVRQRALLGSPYSSRWKRIGGISVILAFLTALLLNDDVVWSLPLLAVSFLSGAILMFGLLDDWFDIAPANQLAFQLFLGIALFMAHVRILSIPLPFAGTVFLDRSLVGMMVGLVVLLVWTLLIMNAVNWADGVDGLLGAVSSIGFATILLLALRPDVYQPTVAILASMLLGVSLGFLVFNAPHAQIFAGTSGSFFFGFALSALAVFSGTKIATSLLALSVPIADALWVIWERIRSGYSPFHGNDARHLHYRLRELGWSDRRIVVVYSLASLVASAIALGTQSLGKFVAFIGVGALIIIFLVVVARQAQHRSSLLS